MNLSNFVKQHCLLAIQQAFPDLTDVSAIELTPATQEKFGHYQLNSAMKLAKTLGVNPRQVAEKIVAAFSLLPDYPNAYQLLEIAGPGFINLTLKPEFLASILSHQLQDPRLGVLAPDHPLKVVIDFSSPNVAKEMHVGHLRTTIIGDSLANLLTFMGHDVLRLNHIGDWGTQFGMLIAHLKEVLPEITHSTPPTVELGVLVQWYKDSKKRFDEDPHFKKEAQQEVVALQSGNETSKRAWEHICAISRKAYQHIYDILDIKIIERGESFYNPYLSEIIQDLEQKNLITLSDGAKCMVVPGFTNRENEPLPLILQKTDGGYNYATTDLAALRHRVQVEKGEWLIYVVDAGQTLHFQMIFEAGKMAGYYDPLHTKADHVAFGLVLNSEGKKFKTRSGETERLIDLLTTAVSKAKEKLLEHNPNLSAEELEHSSKILGINAVKYADLSCHRLSDYTFSYEKMLKFEGNTAAFLLYAYARIRSIQRKVKVDIHDLVRHNASVDLEEPAEIALALLVCQFCETLEYTAKELAPNRLTDYLYRLAEKFHVFFHQCRVEGSPKQESRLRLCEAVAQVLHRGMLILGLKPLERM